ncbi:MAG TPA: hypothetical protein VGM29_19070 [Polyangiaceae bacterium]
MALFEFADEPKGALAILQSALGLETGETTPAFAKSRTARRRDTQLLRVRDASAQDSRF